MEVLPSLSCVAVSSQANGAVRLYHLAQDAATGKLQIAHAYDFSTRDDPPGVLQGGEEEEGEGEEEEEEAGHMVIGLTAWQHPNSSSPGVAVATVDSGMRARLTVLGRG